MENTYKKTVAGTVGAGISAVFNASGRRYYILEHKTETAYHHAGESQKVIVDQVELGRDAACQVRFDEACETVSRRHAAIVREGENWKIIPLSSTNVTMVNGAPINGETILNNGDEIRLSSRGPVMGFIVPQGAQSMVKSIGLTERMNLFRKQALRPYKTAIIILAVALVLAIGGLSTWNILQGQAAKKEIAAAQEAAAAAQTAVDAAMDELDQANAELEKLAQNASASQAELAAARRRANEAQRAAQAAQSAAAAAVQNLDAVREEFAERAEAAAAVQPEETVAATPAAPEQATTLTSLEECYDAVYYVRMDNILIYDRENELSQNLNTEDMIGGTGFLLSDGRFITADRVIEPWFYYSGSTKIADGGWTYQDVQFCVKAGLKVVAHFTAFSPSGSNFKFTSSDITHNRVGGVAETVSARTAYIRHLTGERNVKIDWFSDSPASDWASMAKRSLRNEIGFGLEFDPSYAPVAGTEVAILGYPLEKGFVDTHSVRPVDLRNNVNVSTLNDKNVIELSSRRYKAGNDGAPVLYKAENGQWTVIGILSHTDSADRDLVIPIGNARK